MDYSIEHVSSVLVKFFKDKTAKEGIEYFRLSLDSWQIIGYNLKVNYKIDWRMMSEFVSL